MKLSLSIVKTNEIDKDSMYGKSKLYGDGYRIKKNIKVSSLLSNGIEVYDYLTISKVDRLLFITGSNDKNRDIVITDKELTVNEILLILKYYAGGRISSVKDYIMSEERKQNIELFMGVNNSVYTKILPILKYKNCHPGKDTKEYTYTYSGFEFKINMVNQVVITKENFSIYIKNLIFNPVLEIYEGNEVVYNNRSLIDKYNIYKYMGWAGISLSQIVLEINHVIIESRKRVNIYQNGN